MTTKVNFNQIKGAVFNVLDYGANTAPGTTDMTAAAQAAVTACAAAGGGTVCFPAGIYLLNGATGDTKKNGILIPYTTQTGVENRVCLEGDGMSTILRAGSTGMYIIRLSDSYCAIRNMSIDGNNLATVTGIGIVPASTTQTTTLAYQNFNLISNVEVRQCVEGIELKCGPDVSGADSQCFYNEFHAVNMYSCTRGMWFRDGPNASSSGCNRNSWHGGRIGQDPANTGIQIDSGDTNEFFGVHFEGIVTGTSPNATPSAIYIALSGTYSGNNNNNAFYGSVLEANSRDIDNKNTYTQLFGCAFDPTKVNFAGTGVLPMLIIGGGDFSVVPQVGPWGVYQTNNQLAAYSNGWTFPTDIGNQDVNGNMFAVRSYTETSGNTGSILNGATADITVPYPRKPQLLTLYSSYNLSQGSLYFVRGDASGTITATSILASGATAAGQTATTIRITNSYGGTATIYWSLVPLGAAI